MILFDVFLIMFVARDNYNLGLRACREASSSTFRYDYRFPKAFCVAA